eukprot:TRINITY_DN58273_c0_g1_i1.p1 TRINITY_DN58273_c0_g1~~TRINITY_DN58273_c0_g1_i1.p1  ORF type:complete len:343 (+),score=36.87 TRINITY_DN58273_c0_g1_i1:35-1030(+)
MMRSILRVSVVVAHDLFFATALDDFSGTYSLQIKSMLHDLFGDFETMQQMADAWTDDGAHVAAQQLGEPRVGKSLRPEVSLWLRLTQLLAKVGRYEQQEHNLFSIMAGQSATRTLINRFHSAQGAPSTRAERKRCAETGDGHFMTDYYSRVCSYMAVLDLYSVSRTLPTFTLDLNKPIRSLSNAGALPVQGTFDLVVSSSVFEHLTSPSCAMANMNSLLRRGGRFDFTVPFLYRDHGSPNDFFRFTVQNVRRLFRCGGFFLRRLRGRGNMAAAVFDVAGVPADHLSAEDLFFECDAIDETKGCTNQHYLIVEAVGIKIANVTCAEVQTCFA